MEVAHEQHIECLLLQIAMWELLMKSSMNRRKTRKSASIETQLKFNVRMEKGEQEKLIFLKSVLLPRSADTVIYTANRLPVIDFFPRRTTTTFYWVHFV